MSGLISFLLLYSLLHAARKQWEDPQARHDMRVVGGLLLSLAVLIASAFVVQTQEGQYAVGLGWYAVQFVGIEGPGFLLAWLLTRWLPWLE